MVWDMHGFLPHRQCLLETQWCGGGRLHPSRELGTASSVFPAQVAPPTKVDHSTVGTLRLPQVKYHLTITKKKLFINFSPEMGRNHPSTHLTLLAQGIKKHLVHSRCTIALNVLNVITAVLLIIF